MIIPAMQQLCVFPLPAVTDDYTRSGLKGKKFIISWLGGQESKIKALARWFPSGCSGRDSIPGLSLASKVAAGHPWHYFAAGSLTPTSAAVLPWPLAFFRVSNLPLFSLIRVPHIGFRVQLKLNSG